MWLIETVNFSIEFRALILLMNSVLDFLSTHWMNKAINQELFSLVLQHWLCRGFTGGDFFGKSFRATKMDFLPFLFPLFLRQAEFFRVLVKEGRMIAAVASYKSKRIWEAVNAAGATVNPGCELSQSPYYLCALILVAQGNWGFSVMPGFQ